MVQPCISGCQCAQAEGHPHRMLPGAGLALRVPKGRKPRVSPQQTCEAGV